jgi:hypothetical protein
MLLVETAGMLAIYGVLRSSGAHVSTLDLLAPMALGVVGLGSVFFDLVGAGRVDQSRRRPSGRRWRRAACSRWRSRSRSGFPATRGRPPLGPSPSKPRSRRRPEFLTLCLHPLP